MHLTCGLADWIALITLRYIKNGMQIVSFLIHETEILSIDNGTPELQESVLNLE